MNLNVLVVDDSKTALAALEEVLTQLGCRAALSGSAAEALKLLDRREFDLVLSDLVMPDMDGLELMKRIKDRRPQIPVILITQYASLDTAVEALRQGAEDYLIKPAGVELLGRRVGAVMARRNLAEETAERHRLEGALAMAGAAAHELNQPLTVVMGAAELMTVTDDPERLKELAGRIIGESERMGDIIKRLARVVRFQTKRYLDQTDIVDLEAAADQNGTGSDRVSGGV